MRIRIKILIHPLALLFAFLACVVYLIEWCVRAALMLFLIVLGEV